MAMNVTGKTTFSQIHDQYKTTSRTSTGEAAKGMRLQTSTSKKYGLVGEKVTVTKLYTKPSFQATGKSQSNIQKRLAKFENAAELIKQSIDNELGEGAGDKVLQKVGKQLDRDLSKKILRSDLNLIKSTMDEVKNAQTLKNLQTQLLSKMDELPNPPLGTMAHENTKADPMRSGTLSKEGKLALQSGDISKLDIEDTAHGFFKMLGECGPILSRDHFQTLLQADCLEQAVGDFTYLNTMGEKPIGPEHELAQPLSKQKGGEALRDLINKTLSSDEKAALKERVEFIANLSTKLHTKVGLCAQDSDHTTDTLAWAKTLTVAGGANYMGYPITELYGKDSLSGTGNLKSDIGVGRDLFTALVMHRDLIFGNE